MPSTEPSFGPFGSSSPTIKRRSFRRRLITAFITLGVAGFVIHKVIGVWTSVRSGFLERQEPSIELLSIPRGFGLNPADLKISISDPDAGIDEVKVRIEQSGEIYDVLSKSYPDRKKKDVLELVVDAQNLGLREGEARLSVVAFDRSFWSNSAKKSLSLSIDYQTPSIEVLTTQHNAVHGGVELVFYRVKNEQNAFSGVAVGPYLFPGFPAEELDPAFAVQPEVHFAFFSIPLDFNSSMGKVRLLARDAVGNDTTASFYYRVRSSKTNTHKEKVSDQSLSEYVDTQYQHYLEDKAEVMNTEVKEFFPSVSEEEQRERFFELVEQYPLLVEQILEPLFSRPKSERYWRGKFARPPGGQLGYRPGDTKELFLGESPLGILKIKGAEYKTATGKQIRTANAGKVVYADRLGLYGNTVIVDHGFGLATLYGNLLNINCSEGDDLSLGEVIATSGISPLTGNPRVIFEVRMHGVAVRPEEWWDARWLEDHIETKIANVKRDLGIKSIRALRR